MKASEFKMRKNWKLLRNAYQIVKEPNDLMDNKTKMLVALQDASLKKEMEKIE